MKYPRKYTILYILLYCGFINHEGKAKCQHNSIFNCDHNTVHTSYLSPSQLRVPQVSQFNILLRSVPSDVSVSVSLLT